MTRQQKRDVYVALARAAASLPPRGVRLTADEVRDLVAGDDAIATAAETCESECVCDILRKGGECAWCAARSGEGNGL